MKILITGGSGFIGSRLARFASQLGHTVTVTAALNSDSERMRYESLKARGHRGDGSPARGSPRLESVLKGQDAVIHLAAAQHEAHEPESYFHRVNVQGTRNLIGLAFNAASAASCTAAPSACTVRPRTMPCSPKRAHSRPTIPTVVPRPRRSRWCAPTAIASRLCIVRISETYGPGDMRLLKLFRAIARGRYFTIGNGRNVHQVIYVDDLARGLLSAASVPAAAGATVIIAGAQAVSTDEMVAAIRKALGKTGTGLHVPLWPFNVAAFAFEKTSQPARHSAPAASAAAGFFPQVVPLFHRSAERVLGVRPEVSFEEGARRTGEWYRENGLLG